jgi:hypothetical protein
MQTIFRAVVMIVIGAVVVKGWKLYGPTNEQVKSGWNHGKELVQSFMDSHRPSATSTTPDPRIGATRIADTNTATAPPRPTGFPAAPATSAPTEAPKLLPENGLSQAGPPGIPSAMTPPGAMQSGATPDRVNEMISHLQQLGAADTKLSPWGGGAMYRFTCRAPLANAPAMTQHFEAVAAEPEKAVADVVAKVEAWRVAQRERMRY